MVYVVFAAIIIALIFGPQLWARHVFKRYGEHDPSFPGSGGELARHLLNRFKLDAVGVETSNQGDHYDPASRTVRLSAENFNGRSLTAVVVAAHEVGHALQHAEGYWPLTARTRLALALRQAERFGSMLLIAAPIVVALTHAPALGGLALIAGVATLCAPVLLHLITLPVELHASFRRALPLLASGYLPDDRLPAARRILTAAALTYVASSLASLLNVWRWLRLLRR